MEGSTWPLFVLVYRRSTVVTYYAGGKGLYICNILLFILIEFMISD